MTEPTNNQPDPQQPPENDGGQPPAQQPGQQDDDGQQPGPVPYERFKAVNEKNKELETRLAKVEETEKKRQETQLAEQEKWKELAEKREQELQAERTERLRLQVATSKGLPVDLAGRLTGSTEQELSEDADRLLQFIKPASGPGVPPSGGPRQPARMNLADMSPDEIRKNRDKIWRQEGS